MVFSECPSEAVWCDVLRMPEGSCVVWWLTQNEVVWCGGSHRVDCMWHLQDALVRLCDARQKTPQIQIWIAVLTTVTFRFLIPCGAYRLMSHGVAHATCWLGLCLSHDPLFHAKV